MSVLNRIATFARSPQGRRLAQQAQRIARDPRTRQQIANLRAKIARR